MPTHIPFASLRAMPWKNGGGSTTEIMVWPQGAGLDAFAWRISLATIATDGLFSIFAGIDRTLSLVSGQGVDLRIEPSGQAPATVALRPDNPALRFPGEWPIMATLPDGVTQDFNVMTRRNTCQHEFARLSTGQRYTRRAPLTLMFLASATPLHLRSGAATFSLQQYDSVLLQEADQAECEWHLAAPANAEVSWFVVELMMSNLLEPLQEPIREPIREPMQEPMQEAIPTKGRAT